MDQEYKLYRPIPLFIFMSIFQINVSVHSQIVTGLVTEISRHVETVAILLLVQKALFT